MGQRSRQTASSSIGSKPSQLAVRESGYMACRGPWRLKAGLMPAGLAQHADPEQPADNTPLSRQATIHLALRPGTSGALALGMAHVIIEEGLYDREFVENWTLGFSEYRAYTARFTPRATSEITGVPAEKIIAAARLYATTKPAAVVNSASVTVHHTNGVQNHRAITVLVGLTGNFDRPGGSHVVTTSYYHRHTGLKNREDEFEQPRPWSDMAARVGIFWRVEISALRYSRPTNGKSNFSAMKWTRADSSRRPRRIRVAHRPASAREASS